jgi:hypothetical protein
MGEGRILVGYLGQKLGDDHQRGKAYALQADRIRMLQSAVVIILDFVILYYF